MQYRFTKEIYSKEALLKAAYRFIDEAYIHLGTDEQDYIVDLHLKASSKVISEEEFKNVLLSEMVRQVVSSQTRNVRELMMARAFASTVVTELPESSMIDEDADDNGDIDAILKDWFAENE